MPFTYAASVEVLTSPTAPFGAIRPPQAHAGPATATSIEVAPARTILLMGHLLGPAVRLRPGLDGSGRRKGSRRLSAPSVQEVRLELDRRVHEALDEQLGLGGWAALGLLDEGGGAGEVQ